MSNLRHGGRGTRLYECWKHMHGRCHNRNAKDYPSYGGRGITVCLAWNNFGVFRDWAEANGYKDWLTLDRINNDHGYFPENCRWTTDRTQANNRRNSIIVEAFNERKTLAEWATDKRCKVAYTTLYYRINSGWPGESALTKQSRNATVKML